MQKTIFIIIYTVFIYSIGYSADLNFVVTSDSVKCFKGSTGKITVNILSGNPGFEIKLYDKKPATKQKFMARANTETNTYSFSELTAKNYYITVEYRWFEEKGGIKRPDISIIDHLDFLRFIG